MKIIPKKQFDEVVALSREYWNSGVESILHERIDKAEAIARPLGLSWLVPLEMVDSIISPSGLLPNADNDTIYTVFRVCGWEVADEEQTSESL